MWPVTRVAPQRQFCKRTRVCISCNARRVGRGVLWPASSQVSKPSRANVQPSEPKPHKALWTQINRNIQYCELKVYGYILAVQTVGRRLSNTNILHACGYLFGIQQEVKVYCLSNGLVVYSYVCTIHAITFLTLSTFMLADEKKIWTSTNLFDSYVNIKICYMKFSSN